VFLSCDKKRESTSVWDRLRTYWWVAEWDPEDVVSIVPLDWCWMTSTRRRWFTIAVRVRAIGIKRD
jgi:hypothetical protein